MDYCHLRNITILIFKKKLFKKKKNQDYVLEKGPLVADSANTMPKLSLVAVSLAELAHQRHIPWCK